MVSLQHLANGNGRCSDCNSGECLHTPETGYSVGPRRCKPCGPNLCGYDYDLVVIGGGSAGVRAARYSAKFGARVALVELPRAFIAGPEAGGLGGTCVLRGCVPKKLLALAGEMRENFEVAKGFGWQFNTQPQHDWQKLREAKTRDLERLSDTYARNLVDAGVEVLEGRAQFADAHTVQVGDRKLRSKYLVVATGSTATRLPISGAEHTIISDDILHLEACPKKLVIVGGGYIACEQACIYTNFGTEVHLMYRKDLPLTGFDRECCRFIATQYEKLGVHLHPCTSPTSVTKGADGKLKVHAETKDKHKIVLEDVDHVLVAAGRKPNTKGLGLDKVGVELNEKGGVEVDQYCRSVSAQHIFAIGDVNNRSPLTPVARMEGSQLARFLFGGQKDAKPEYDLVPSVVFSSPAMATVGLSEEDATDKLKDVDIFSSTYTPMMNSLSNPDRKALVKVVVHAADQRVAGFHMVGTEAAEIMQGFAAAMVAGITKDQLDRTVGLHPTNAEEFVTLASPQRSYRGGKQVQVDEE